jgi:hypothetical protein
MAGGGSPIPPVSLEKKAPRGRPDPKHRPNKFRPDCLQVPSFCFGLKDSSVMGESNFRIEDVLLS